MAYNYFQTKSFAQQKMSGKPNDAVLGDSSNTVVVKGVIKKKVFSNDETGFTVVRFIYIATQAEKKDENFSDEKLPDENLSDKSLNKSVNSVKDKEFEHKKAFEHKKEPAKIKNKTAKKDQIYTAAGVFGTISPGEIFLMKGYWSSHPKFGYQFKVLDATVALPDTVDGIKAYLGSGMIKGIGKEYAAKIVDFFGSKTLDILDNRPEFLKKVPGIGKKRHSLIASAWKEHQTLREVMIFLQSYGISTAFAHRIYKKYGDNAIFDVTSNPYRLCEDIHGMGFKSADKIAMRMKIDADSIERAQAAILYCLNTAMEQGHCYYPLNDLKDALVHLIGETCPGAEDYEFINNALCQLETRGRIIRAGNVEDPFLCWIFLEKVYKAEEELAIGIYRLAHDIKINELKFREVDKIVSSMSQLSNTQAEAVKRVFKSGISVITGGPGTGKTTTMKSLIRVLLKLNLTFALASPTGRAAKRLSETTGMKASTVHRLLEFSPLGSFQKNRENPLKHNVIVIDEASMLDLFLANSLVQALTQGTRLILVGDTDQLPSVGPGSVLRDIIASKIGTTSTLTEIFRQAGKSMIVTNAHRINKGLFPLFKKDDVNDMKRDFYFIPEEESENLPQVIADLVKKRLPAWKKFDPVRDIQVLTPMHKGSAGVISLNQTLKEALNKEKNGIKRGDITFARGDKIMVIRNNYSKELFNGDMGLVVKADIENYRLIAEFDGKLKTFERGELHEIELAYAISIHKSQGSEYPAVVIPVHTQHFIMLYRNLIYTAVTRARELAVIVGNVRGLSIAVKKCDTMTRYTMLTRRLKEMQRD